jgi:hypothetical protein
MNVRMANSPKIHFEVLPMKMGSGWYVLVTIPNAVGPKLGGFKTEEEAKSWIARESREWLKMFEGGRYA